MSDLLTLDLATRIGWTRGPPRDRGFRSGFHQLPRTGQELGPFLAAFRDWLDRTLPGVSMVVFESPILPRTTSLATARKLYAQAAYLELACFDRRTRCLEANNMTVKAFLGVAGIKGKEATVRAVHAYGYSCENDDEADAIAIRLYAVHRLYPEARGAFHTDLGPLGARHTTGSEPSLSPHIVR